MYEALSHRSEQDYGDTELILLVGAGRESIGALVERLAGRHAESSDFCLTVEELPMVHSALTVVPLRFTGREGAFLEEPFNIRRGFYWERTLTSWRTSSSARRPRRDTRRQPSTARVLGVKSFRR